MEPTIKRASNANPVEDARLVIGESLGLPLANNLEGLDPGHIALGPNGLILKDRDGNTLEVGEGGVKPEDFSRGLIFTSDNKVTLDLDSTTLVTPVIKPVWTLQKADGTVYVPSSSIASNIVVDKGVKASLSATFLNPSPEGGEAYPVKVSGSFGTVLPAPGTESSALVVPSITADTSFSLQTSKPKSGLSVVGGQVKFAEGDDVKTASISIAFRSKSWVGYSPNLVLSAAQVLNLSNGAFVTGKARTINGVSAGPGMYTYIVYEASFGPLTSILMDGAAPVLDAFTKLANMPITTDGGATIVVCVYKSNAPQAFTNNSLTLS